MIKYQIEKPEKGAGLLEYLLKFLTIFFFFGIAIWALLIYLFTKFISDSGLTENIYNYSLILSAIIVVGIILVMVKRLITKLKLGAIYQFEFDNAAKELTIQLMNEYTGEEVSKSIPYQSFSITEVKQKIEVKSEMTISIFKDQTLVNTLRIAKTAWNAHPEIVKIVEKIREVAP